MNEPIRGKVARVLNTREIAINIGTADGLTVGMYFDVMDTCEDIRDPDTEEVLGSIEIPKVRVRVTYVKERLSVATTYQSRKEYVGGSPTFRSLGPFSESLMPPKLVTKYETLKQTDATKAELDEKYSYVKSGDTVVQVIEKTE